MRGSPVEARGRITGGRLAAASALVFLLPPIGLIVGAGLGEEGAQGPLTGACAGFFVGVGLAWLITRWWRPQRMEQDE